MSLSTSVVVRLVEATVLATREATCLPLLLARPGHSNCMRSREGAKREQGGRRIGAGREKDRSREREG